MWMFADITFERSLLYSYKTNHLCSSSIFVSIGTLLRLYILHHAAVFTVTFSACNFVPVFFPLPFISDFSHTSQNIFKRSTFLFDMQKYLPPTRTLQQVNGGVAPATSLCSRWPTCSVSPLTKCVDAHELLTPRRLPTLPASPSVCLAGRLSRESRNSLTFWERSLG